MITRLFERVTVHAMCRLKCRTGADTLPAGDEMSRFRGRKSNGRARPG